jgi:electron transport complex protein RnfG
MTMNNILKLAGILTLICTICTVILAAVNAVTQGPIALAKEKNILEAAKKVLPPGAEPIQVEALTALENQAVRTNVVFVAKDAAGTVQAVAVRGMSKNGYGGPVMLMVGIAADGTLINFEVIEQTETPGLGTKITEEPFRKRLIRRPDGTPRPIAGTQWKVTRDGGEIDAVTAATISSRAALEAVRDAIATYEAVKGRL